MKYDLWDVAASRYLGRFDSEAAALESVRALLVAHGDDFADNLVLGSTEDRRGERKLTGAALIARASSIADRSKAAGDLQPAYYGSHLADPVTLAAGPDERALKQAAGKPWSPSKAIGTAGTSTNRADIPAPPNPIHGQQPDSIMGRRRTQPPKKG